jgi:carboxypeptidase family protein
MQGSIALGLGLGALMVAAGPPDAPAAPAASSGQVRGTISYGRHAPAVGAIVIVRPESTPSPVRVATTGTAGTFAFDGLPDGAYRAEVRRDGFAPVVKSGIQVRAPFRAVVEVLLVRGETPQATVPAAGAVEGGASLTGTIRVAFGAPVAEVRVRLTRRGGGDEAHTFLTDAAGGFSWPQLAAGRWRLDVQGAGLLPLRADLDLAGDVALEAQLAAQPANYRPLPQDLIVPEDVIPPAAP